MPLNAGIAIVPGFTMDTGHVLSVLFTQQLLSLRLQVLISLKRIDVLREI